MNKPNIVIHLVNIAHFIDHYAMLIFATAILQAAPALGASYGEMLPVATPGFFAFGAGSILTGWLGDQWSRRHMMVIFFAGIGSSMIAVGLARTSFELGIALFFVGAFAAIYHPVGTAMLVSYSEKLGREIGINGVWGNLGVAASALITGLLSLSFGWRFSFIVPGVMTILIGVVFAINVSHEIRKGHATANRVRVAPGMAWRVLVALTLTVVAGSTAFNAVTVSLPKLFAERLADVLVNPAELAATTSIVFLFGAIAQYWIGGLIDRLSLRATMLPLALALVPLLFLASFSSDFALLAVSAGIVMGIFGQNTINDAMVGRYTDEHWRARAYAVRYFLGFTAAAVAVQMVAVVHESGGFAAVYKILAALSLLLVFGSMIFPGARSVAVAEAAKA